MPYRARTTAFGLSLAVMVLLGFRAVCYAAPGKASTPSTSQVQAPAPVSRQEAAAKLRAGSGSAVSPKLEGLRLLPENATLWGAKASQRFVVMGSYSDGVERDVTSIARLSLSREGAARISGNAKVVAVADGQVTLTASVGGRSASTSIRVSGSEEQRPFSFARDLGGIFTKRGCNNSDCHGSVKGKGGLKLSANALYPRDDYKWIVEGGTYQVLSADPGEKIPRINLKEPDKSVLLAKPTMELAHGGGQRFNKDSADYTTILDWVKNGAPYGKEDTQGAVRVVGLDVMPQEVVLDRSGKQQLLVTAQLSNGRREDVTEAVLYTSNNPEVVDVNEDGLVSAVKTGETSVMIRAAGHAISTGFGVIEKPVSNYPVWRARNFIDEQVFAKLKKFNIIPSEDSGDAEFLRRVCLDLAGTLPPPKRAKEFIDSRDPQKRDKLIEALLGSPEFIDFWTFRFADLFRVSFEQGSPAFTKMYWEWMRNNIASNKPYDQVARERVGGQGYNGPTRHWYGGSDLRRPQDMMAEEVRVFLGRRLDCAQCHNHPYETWSQNQFWGLTAFFGRLTHIGDLGGAGPAVIFDDPAGHGENGGGAKVLHPRTKQEVPPSFLDGKVLAETARVDLRQRLAEWMTSPQNPYFAQAAVNRIWGYFFGRGIVNPVDDFRLTNPPTHPQLLHLLAKDFREHGHDLRRLMRLIVQSKTYQLSGVPNESNRDDRINYSHALPRALEAEVLLDALSHVTEIPETFEDDSGARMPAASRAVDIVFFDTFPSQFLDIYGRPNRLMVPERKGEANIAQALHLLAGPTYTEKISKEGGRVDRLAKAGLTNREIIEDLYVAALSRLPTAEELGFLTKRVSQRASRREALEDLVWSLVTSREFAYNH
ncbi:MAG: DUF1553 domain-containing protein [Acidimicrobiia bacterium]|nr:DUF1553 domain-containing protein [Acidimicrobiia bacterium]